MTEYRIVTTHDETKVTIDEQTASQLALASNGEWTHETFTKAGKCRVLVFTENHSLAERDYWGNAKMVVYINPNDKMVVIEKDLTLYR